jgi:hypothetical protein
VTESQVTVDAALAGVESLEKFLKRLATKQVSSDDEKRIAKATALAWFNKQPPVVARAIGDDHLKSVDDLYPLLIARNNQSKRAHQISLDNQGDQEVVWQAAE